MLKRHAIQVLRTAGHIGTRLVTFTESVENRVIGGETLIAHRWVSVAVVEPGVTQQPYDTVLGYGPTGPDARVDAEQRARHLIPAGAAS
jgi:hypothetical protein